MKVLVVHNRYRSEQPSGGNTAVDEEVQLLSDAGCEVRCLEMISDEIDGRPLRKKGRLAFRVVWSMDGYLRASTAARRFRPGVAHFHTFPLFNPSALCAAPRSPAAVIQTLHNFRALCLAANFLRNGSVCPDCLGRLPLPAVVHRCYRGSRLATALVAAMAGVHNLLGGWTRCVDAFVVPAEFARRKYIGEGGRRSYEMRYISSRTTSQLIGIYENAIVCRGREKDD